MFIAPSSDVAVSSEALDFGLGWVAAQSSSWRSSWVLEKRETGALSQRVTYLVIYGAGL